MDQESSVTVIVDPFIGPWYYDGQEIQFVGIDPAIDPNSN